MIPSPWLWRSHYFLLGQYLCQGPTVWSALLTQRPGLHSVFEPESLDFSIQKSFYTVLPTLVLVSFQIAAFRFYLHHLTASPWFQNSIAISYRLCSPFPLPHQNISVLLAPCFSPLPASLQSLLMCVCLAFLLVLGHLLLQCPANSWSFYRSSFRCMTSQLPEMKFLSNYDQRILASGKEWSQMTLYLRTCLAAQLPGLYLHAQKYVTNVLDGEFCSHSPPAHQCASPGGTDWLSGMEENCLNSWSSLTPQESFISSISWKSLLFGD